MPLVVCLFGSDGIVRCSFVSLALVRGGLGRLAWAASGPWELYIYRYVDRYIYTYVYMYTYVCTYDTLGINEFMVGLCSPGEACRVRGRPR